MTTASLLTKKKQPNQSQNRILPLSSCPEKGSASIVVDCPFPAAQLFLDIAWTTFTRPM